MPIPQKMLLEKAMKGPFHIIGDLELIELHDADAKEVNGGFIPEDFDLLAQLSVSYAGSLPESARELNNAVMTWVDANRRDIENLVREPMKEYLAQEYPEMDLSGLPDDAEGFVWDDQVDYLAGLDTKTGKLIFDVELLLDFEP